jgi:hypothetical protein
MSCTQTVGDESLAAQSQPGTCQYLHALPLLLASCYNRASSGRWRHGIG